MKSSRYDKTPKQEDAKANHGEAAIAACARFKEVTGVDLLGGQDIAEIGRDFLAYHEARSTFRYRRMRDVSKQLREMIDTLDTVSDAMFEAPMFDAGQIMPSRFHRTKKSQQATD